MRLSTDKIVMLTMVMATLPAGLRAQYSQSNVDQYVIIEEGQRKINNTISEQTSSMQKTAALQGTIAAEFTMMKNWQGKYNSYLKTVRGYAEALKAGTSLYAEGVKTLRNLYDINKAVNANPVGIGATLCMSLNMNNLYVETATEFVKVYTLLKESVAKGGSENMLTGAERTQMLWQLNDQLCDLNRKLRQIAVSISYYNLVDVWNIYTAGMTDRSHGDIAVEAIGRWKRVPVTVKNMTE